MDKHYLTISCCSLLITREEDSESLATVKHALADATHTAYVRGQWVYSDMGTSGRYRIVGALLPGAGDKDAYTLCGKSAMLTIVKYYYQN